MANNGMGANGAPKRDLKYFMVETEDEIVTAPGPDSFKDENGKVIDFEVKRLSQKDINHIMEMYRERRVATDKKGNPLTNGNEVIFKTDKKSDKAMNHIIVEALVYPDLRDKELMEYYHCVDITEMPLNVFRRADEYSYVLRMVTKILGLSDDLDEDKEDIEAAKN